MKRHLFTILSALSLLLLLVAVCVLWVRSCRTTDAVYRLDLAQDASHLRHRAIISWRGVIAYTEEWEAVPLWHFLPTFEKWRQST